MMNKEKSFNETIAREKLFKNQSSDNFVKHLEKIYSDLISTPHFNDEHVIFEDSGVSFFHKETKLISIVIFDMGKSMCGGQASFLRTTKQQNFPLSKLSSRSRIYGPVFFPFSTRSFSEKSSTVERL